MTEQEQLQKEMNRGVFITIEAPDRRISSKVLTVLETALKYEFKDRKFVTIDPANCTPITKSCQSFLKQDLYGSSYLLLLATIISETVNLIRTNLDAGNNVICTSYLTDMVTELSSYYDPQVVAGTIQLAELSIVKNTEIILLSPVSNDEYSRHRLNAYHAFANAAIEDNTREGNITTTYRIDTTMQDIDTAISEVIGLIDSTLARHDSLKDFAAKLFAPESEAPIEIEEPITVDKE